jgi:hypothetical protein
MNIDRANEIIDNYIAQFPETAGPDKDELFKWKAAAIWKNAWDINTPDFADMLKRAVSGTEMLINSKKSYPASGLVELCAHNSEAAESVRKEFITLLVDVQDVSEEQTRMDGFIERVNALIHDNLSKSWVYEQDRKSVSGYMGLTRPDRDYLYKATQVKAFANYVEFDDNIGSGQTFSLKNFYRLCDELTAVIAVRQDLRDAVTIGLQDYAHSSGIDNITTIDPAYHILVFDIIYCTEHYGFYTTHPHVTVKRVKKVFGKQAVAEHPNPYKEQEKLLMDKLSKQQAEREKLQYPDLTGKSIDHKTLGTGKVVKQDNARIQVKFSGNQFKTMNLEFLFRGGFISNLDADVSETLKKISDLDDEIDITSNELKTVRMKI